MRHSVSRFTLGAALFCAVTSAQNWKQWARNAKHTGSVRQTGQSADQILATVLTDPFVPQKMQDSGGDLLAHYPSPLIDGKDVFLMLEGGSYVPCDGTTTVCGPASWNSIIWNVQKLTWNTADATLDPQWTFRSDWKPEPGLTWEPVFHPVMAGKHLYAPGAGGSVWKIRRSDGTPTGRLTPFSTVDPNIYVAGPITADKDGNLFYNAIQLNPAGALQRDVVNSWLVRIAADGTAKAVTFASLTPGAPKAQDFCLTTFPSTQRPWPPAPNAVPPSAACGSQRPGINISPAVARDGTIYTLSTAHLNSRYSYLIAVRPDLTLKWNTSLRGWLNDGCGVTIPFGEDLTNCRPGTSPGVDNATNELPAARVVDQSSSTPVIAPDGSILFGSYTSYNGQRGHLMHFSAKGEFLNSYDFGWDTTPAIWKHDRTYSIILKDNHYDTGAYFITQLSPEMKIEWQYQNTNSQACSRNDDGTLSCTDAGQVGFEWCINAPAVDANGTVYVNSEDGNLYVLEQGGAVKQRIFLNLALDAAYTPLAIGPDGKIYTQNAGTVFVVGATAPTTGSSRRH